MNPQDEGEVFRKDSGSIDFRTVGWPMASVIFLKRRSFASLDLLIWLMSDVVMFATGVLSIPNAMYSLGTRIAWAQHFLLAYLTRSCRRTRRGAVCNRLGHPKHLSVFMLRCCTIISQCLRLTGDKQIRHISSDVFETITGNVTLSWTCRFLWEDHASESSLASCIWLGKPLSSNSICFDNSNSVTFSFVLVSGSGILGVSIGINALSNHAACTVWWSFLATVVVAAIASIRKFHDIGWVTWAGFASIFIAVLLVV